MHDLDRTQLESSFEFLEAEQWQMPGETSAGRGQNPFDEIQEMELAAEFLEISSEAELDYFLGDLIKKAAGAASSFINSPAGQALGGLLKGAAKKALPAIGAAAGRYLGGDSGAQIGSKLATSAGSMFGLELEGLNVEDREFEVAKQFVRFAGTAANKAAQAAPNAAPQEAAKAAAVEAARLFAPGLLRGGAVAGTAPGSDSAAPRAGRWFRKGRNIVLVNCY